MNEVDGEACIVFYEVILGRGEALWDRSCWDCDSMSRTLVYSRSDLIDGSLFWRYSYQSMPIEKEMCRQKYDIK